MEFILIIISGVMVGTVTSWIMGNDSHRPAGGDIVLGIFGAVVGGFLMHILEGSVTREFDIARVIISIVGALLVVYIGRLVHYT